MKKVFIVFVAALIFTACKTSDKKSEPLLSKEAIEKAKNDSANFTSVKWLDSTYVNLGKLKEGKEVEVTYRFKNIGDKNLIISDVTAGCGCTIPEKPQQPFAPGEEGVIRAKFNGSGHGEIRKEVYVSANTNPSNSHTLVFVGEIIK